MKTLIIYLFILIFPLAVSAQGKVNSTALTDVAFDKEYANRPQPQIRGKVLNATPADLEGITIKYTLVHPGPPFQSSYTTKLATDGTFKISLPEKLPNRQIWFTFGSYAYMGLYSDEDLELTFDLDKLKQKFVYWNGDGIVFGGKDGAKNQLMNEYILFNQKNNADFSKKVNALDAKSTNYLPQLDSLFSIQKGIMEIFYAKYGKVYQYLIESETQSNYLEKKMTYLLENEIALNGYKELLLPVQAISNDLYGYTRLLNNYVRSSFQKTGQKFSLDHYATYCDSILPPAYADLLMLQFGNPDIKLQRDLLEKIKPSLHLNWSKDYVNSQIATLNQKILNIDSISNTAVVANGKETPIGKLLLKSDSGTILYLDQHASGDEFLKDLKTLFPNKLVVIDFWATWCVPCIQAMPLSKELHKQAKEANLAIEFVYICTSSNSSEEKWKNKVLEIGQPGIHVFVNEKVTSEAMNLFNKSGFPSYIMLKSDGTYDSETISSMHGLTLDMLKAKL